MPLRHPLFGLKRFAATLLTLLLILAPAARAADGAASPLPPAAQNTLTITPAPLVIAADQPAQLTIKRGADTLSGDAAKFSAVDNGFTNNQNDFIAFDPATLKVTPRKSGKTKLKVKYQVSETETAVGEIDVTVKYKEVVAKTSAPEIVEGQSASLQFEATDIKGQKATGVKVEAKSDNSAVVVDNATSPPTLKAQPVDVETQAAVTLSVDGQEYQKLSAKVKKAVTRVEVLEGSAVHAQVGNTVRLTMPEGTNKELKFRPVDDKGKTYTPAERPVTVSPPTNNELVTMTIDGDTLKLSAGRRQDENRITSTILLTAARQGAGAQDAVTTVVVTVVPRNSFIELRTYPSNFLLPTGRISIPATVRRRVDESNVREDRSAVVTFEHKNPTKDKIWVNLTQEGNTATVTWREPTEAEIRDAYAGQTERRPSEVVIVAKATVDNQTIESQVAIRMGRAEKFQLLDVKLNLMDARTVSDLYGSVTNDEYYVMNVRLFNNLKDPDTREYIGTSILAYSSSIEVAIQLEKKFDRDSGSHFDNVLSGGKAREINKKRSEAIAKLMEAEAQAFLDSLDGDQGAQALLRGAYDAQNAAQREAVAREATAQALIKRARTTRKPEDKDAANAAIRESNAARVAASQAVDNTIRVRDDLIRSANARTAIPPDAFSSMAGEVAIDDGRWHPVTTADLDRIAPAPPPHLRTGDFIPELTDADLAAPFSATPDAPPTVPEPEPSCKGAIKYRPLTFEMMVNTVDRRDGRSKRSIAFKLLEAVGTGTSFVTSVAVPAASNDLPLGLEKYRNLLIPGLDRLVPSLKEQQRQNIVSQAMKELEEIPFGSDITRVLFIPKKSIRGLIRGHEARISEVCPYYFKVEVAIIQKGGSVQQGTITR